MRGLVWCIWFVGIGVPLVLLGLALGAEKLTAIGAGLVAVVVVGWPVLLLAGAAHDATRRRVLKPMDMSQRVRTSLPVSHH